MGHSLNDNISNVLVVKAYISILHKAETATVVVELEELQGGVCSTDYLSILLIDGGWEIFSKAFNLYWSNNY